MGEVVGVGVVLGALRVPLVALVVIHLAPAGGSTAASVTTRAKCADAMSGGTLLTWASRRR